MKEGMFDPINKKSMEHQGPTLRECHEEGQTQSKNIFSSICCKKKIPTISTADDGISCHIIWSNNKHTCLLLNVHNGLTHLKKKREKKINFNDL